MPLLVYVVGASAQEAAAMSLVIVAASTWLGVWEYGRAGHVQLKAAVAFSWTGVIGSWLGAYGHRLVRGEVLLMLFGILLLLARWLMMRQSQSPACGDGRRSCADLFPRTCWLKVAGIGPAVGAVNGFFGIGGGFLIVPALALILRFPHRHAVGTSLCIIAFISLGGILGHLQFGDLDVRATGLVLLGSATGMLLGARLPVLVSPKVMGRAMATVTVSIALTLFVMNAVKLLGVHV
jgi:uncharacterized membrane protein YfcA